MNVSDYWTPLSPSHLHERKRANFARIAGLRAYRRVGSAGQRHGWPRRQFGAAPGPWHGKEVVLPMRDQRSGVASVGRCSDEVQFVVLALLLDLECPGPWCVGELAREVGCELSATDAVVRLQGAGLAHRCGEFVFASHAACRFSQLLRE